jgi:hypothetical protein
MKASEMFWNGIPTPDDKWGKLPDEITVTDRSVEYRYNGQKLARLDRGENLLTIMCADTRPEDVLKRLNEILEPTRYILARHRKKWEIHQTSPPKTYRWQKKHIIKIDTGELFPRTRIPFRIRTCQERSMQHRRMVETLKKHKVFEIKTLQGTILVCQNSYANKLCRHFIALHLTPTFLELYEQLQQADAKPETYALMFDQNEKIYLAYCGMAHLATLYKALNGVETKLFSNGADWIDQGSVFVREDLKEWGIRPYELPRRFAVALSVKSAVEGTAPKQEA